MSWMTHFFRSTLGKKAVMAVSGILLFGFVLTHMAGNLKMYQGPDKYNAYAEGLREIGAPILPHGGALWIARAVLLAAVVLHIWSAVALTRQSRSARGGRYQKNRYVQADYAVRTMRWGGLIIALFILYHLLHLTWGWGAIHPEFIPHTEEAGYSVYHNVVEGLSSLPAALIYIVANIALGFHLYHGLWSMFQTLGWNHPTINQGRRTFAWLFAFLITAGNISFPVAVLAGIVQ